MPLAVTLPVMAGPDPAICSPPIGPRSTSSADHLNVDGRVEPGHVG